MFEQTVQNGKPATKILVVDDEAQIVDALTDLLEDDYEVVGARSADAALAALREDAGIAVILCDQRMPKITGDELLAEARQISPAVRVLVTGYADLQAVVRAVNEGNIFRYISKPWNPKTVRETVADAVEAYRLNQSLVSEGELLRQLLENATDAVAFKDGSHRYVELNGPEAEMLGTANPTKALGRTAADFLPRNRVERLHAKERTVLDGGMPIRDFIEHVSAQDGPDHWYTHSKAPIRNTEGEIVGLVSITRDITESKQLDKLKDEFVSIVNHELRTPLTAMQGSLSLLLSGKLAELAPAVAQLIDVTYRNCRRLTRLITDVLEYGDLRRGDFELELKEVDLIELIRNEIDLVTPVFDQQRVSIRFEHSMPTYLLTADPERIGAVIQQMLGNAAKHSPSGTEVVISADAAPDRPITVGVSDNGPGIPDHLLASIFDPFAQVDSSDQRATSGVGLGLAICRCIVERHGGTIDAANRPEGGLRIEISLPETDTG